MPLGDSLGALYAIGRNNYPSILWFESKEPLMGQKLVHLVLGMGYRQCVWNSLNRG